MNPLGERMGQELHRRKNRLLVILGGLVLVLWSRLSWVSYPVLYGVLGPAYEALEIGWEGGSMITGVLGLILLLIGVLWKGRAGKIYSAPEAILAALALVGATWRTPEKQE
jgi:hypothetical protein